MADKEKSISEIDLLSWVVPDQSLMDARSIRKNIIDFEQQLKEQGGAFVGDNDLCPLTHSFSDGIYVREIFIPAGVFLTGKIHKHAHPNFLMSGEVDVITEGGGAERLKGPLSIMSPAGTKRALKTATDCVWITVHSNPTNTQDLKELEKIVIADSYESYEKFKRISGNKFLSFCKNMINLIKKKEVQ